MACCDNIIKCLLFLTNFIFALSGIAIIVVGALLYEQYKDFDKILESVVSSPPIILMILGSIIFVVAFYGCCGAMTESYCMLVSYSVLLIAIFIAQVAVGVVALVNGTDLLEFFQKILSEEFKNTNVDKASYDLFYALQTQLKCCGVNGYSDYKNEFADSSLKQSCCALDFVGVCVKPNYTAGCAEVLNNFVSDNAKIIGGVGIGIAVIEVIGAIAGLALASWVRRNI